MHKKDRWGVAVPPAKRWREGRDRLMRWCMFPDRRVGDDDWMDGVPSGPDDKDAERDPRL